jgi:hypothetical protein
MTEGTFEKGQFQLIMRDLTEDVRQSTTLSLTAVSCGVACLTL